MKKILKLSLNEMAERLQAVSDFELMDMIGGASPGDCYYEAISYYLRDRGYSNSVDAAWVAQDFGDKMYPPGGVWTEQYGTLTYIDQQTWVQDGPHSEKEYMNYLGNYFKYTEYSSDAIKGGQIDINSNNFMVTFATGNTYNGSQGELPEYHTGILVGYDATQNSYIWRSPDGTQFGAVDADNIQKVIEIGKLKK